MRRILICAGIVNLVAAIAFPLLFSYAAGFGELRVLSMFRELDLKGAIDWEKVRQIEHMREQATNDWAWLPYYMLGPNYVSMTRMSYAMACMMGVSAILLLLSARKMPRHPREERS